jgi:hypothetical protein
MRSKSAAPLRASRPMKQLPLSFMTWGGQAPLLHGAGEGLPGDFGRGAGIDASGHQHRK